MCDTHLITLTSAPGLSVHYVLDTTAFLIGAHGLRISQNYIEPFIVQESRSIFLFKNMIHVAKNLSWLSYS